MRWQLLATADLHFGNNHGAGTVDKRGINSFLRIREAVFKEMIDTAKRKRCPIIVAGDALDAPVVDPATAESFHRCLRYAHKKNVTIVFIAGNHESNGVHSIIGSYAHLKLDNIKFFYEPTVISLGKIQLYCVPYTERVPDDEYKIVRRYIQEATREVNDMHKVLVLHYPIIGCKYDSGSTVTSGFNLGALVASEGNPFDAILAGDFHDRQSLPGVKNFLYLGQPYWSDFSSAGKKRGYTLFNFDLGKRRLVQPKGCPVFRALHNIDKASDINVDLTNTIVRVYMAREADAQKVYEQCYKLGAIKVMIKREPHDKRLLNVNVKYKFDDDRRSAIAAYVKDNKKKMPKGMKRKYLTQIGLKTFKEATQ